VLATALLACLLALLGSPVAWSAPAWLPATDLSAPGRSANSPAVAMDEAGETVAVWLRQDETESNQVIQASTRAPGEGFSLPLQLSNAASEPDVAITPSGEAVAVWRHFDINSGGNYLIQASFRAPGGTFSAPLDVAVTPNQALPRDLHVVVNGAGDTAVVWLQYEPGSELKPNPAFVDASVRPAGGSFSPPVTISALPLVAGQGAQSPDVAIDAAGDVTVVWEYYDGTSELIQAATRPAAAGSFSAPRSLTTDGEDASSPSVAADSGGAVIAVWTRSNGANNIVQTATSTSGGSFSTPADLSAAGENATRPEIAMTPAGQALAVWTRSDGTEEIVEAADSSASGGFSASVRLSEAGGSALDPEVALNAKNVATVVWSRLDGSNEVVQGSTGSAASLSTPIDLSATGQDARFPKVAIDAMGDATAVWARSNGENEIAQAAGYDCDAPVLRSLAIPSSGMVGAPVSFSVTPFDVWPIASTRFGFGDGTGAEGTSVVHTYSAQGTYRVTVTSKDAAGTSVVGASPITILPSNEFAIGRLSLDRKKGTGSLLVTVPGPGRLVLFGRGVKKAIKRPKRAGKVKLPIVTKGKTLKGLLKHGHVRVSLEIAFTPNGGTRRVKHKKVALIKKPHF
jgi:PKD domain